MGLELTLSLFHQRDVFFRFENDEEGFYLSIIDRKKYPRVWVDNDKEGAEIIAETVDNIINRAIPAEKDWEERFFGETINECLAEYNKWYVANRKPGLK
jgi:hypothetical protein